MPKYNQRAVTHTHGVLRPGRFGWLVVASQLMSADRNNEGHPPRRDEPLTRTERQEAIEWVFATYDELLGRLADA